MFKNVLSKTLYEKRWTILGWTVAVIALTLLLVLTFPLVKTLGDSLKQVPESMKGLLGNLDSFQKLWGYFDLKVISSIIFMTIVLAVILFTELIAGKEEKGTLQSLLAQPVKRRTVYLEMFGAALIIMAIVCLGFYIATVAGALAIKEHLDWLKLFYATISLWLVSVLFGTFGYCVGAISGKRGFAGMLTGIIAFTAYLVTLLEPTIKQFKYPNYFSPIKYYNTPSVIQNGLKLNNILIMVIASVVFIVIGYIFFVKRDIYQK